MSREADEDEGDLTIVQIWQLCQDQPQNGLRLLKELPEEFQSSRNAKFAEFLAFRQLALEKMFRLGISTVRRRSDEELRRYFDDEHLKHASDALRALAFIQQKDPTRFDDWGIPEETILSHVDSVCVPLERLAPGSVQAILGWTKLAFMGVDRIGLLPDVRERTPDELFTSTVEVRFTAPKIARSAVALGSGEDAKGRSYVHFSLLERDFNRCPTFGDAGILGDVLLFDDGTYEFVEADGGSTEPAETEASGEAAETGARSGTEQAQDVDDDPVRELLTLSDNDPVEALNWISRLEPARAGDTVILFCRFNAHRHLAVDRLLAAGIKSVVAKPLREIRPHFGPEEMKHASAALSTAAQIEAIDPDYIKSRDFVENMVDNLVSLVDLINPGASQRILGWTKIRYFGSDRIKFVANFLNTVPEEMQRKAINRRFSIQDVVTSAIGYGSGRDALQGNYVDFMLLYRDPEDGETVGDVAAGTLRYFENDEAEYTSEN